MSTDPSSVPSRANPDDQFFRGSIFRSGAFCLTTFALAMGLLDGGIILVRHTHDAAAAIWAVVTMTVPVFYWIRVLVIHRKTRKLTAGFRSAETAAVLQILAQTLVIPLLVMTCLMILALSHMGNAPR